MRRPRDAPDEATRGIGTVSKSCPLATHQMPDTTIQEATTIGMSIMRRSKNLQPNIVTLTRSNEARARAEVSFRQEEQAKEGTKAMMEYQANSRIIREKTIECASIGPDGFSLKSGEHTGAVCGWL
jgi:riboflavin biosynthesis pyrimidine reductase